MTQLSVCARARTYSTVRKFVSGTGLAETRSLTSSFKRLHNVALCFSQSRDKFTRPEGGGRLIGLRVKARITEEVQR